LPERPEPRTGDHTTAPTLRRALGRWDLTAIGINQVIGGAIFLMPSQVAAEIGAWSPIAFVLMGLASLSVALCFAEVGSRFERTGGPYLYTRAAFGWMQWFTRASSQATVMAGIPVALGYYRPVMMADWPRATLLIAVTAALTWVNVRGIRQSAWVVNALTIGKLLPLALFIVAGLRFIEPATLTSLPPVSLRQFSAAALLMIFVYGGYDVVPVPAGEALDPRRHVPSALIITILAVMTLMTLAQVVAQSVLADLAGHSTPLADAAAVFLGSSGALLIGLGSIVSMTGNNAGQVLTGSRMLFALAEHGELPAFFGRIHPRFRTPANAVMFTSLIALTLALTGSFAKLAVVSAVARLVTYTGVAAATLRLRSPRFAATVKPATFVAPLGPLVPAVALIVSLAIVAGATRQQLLGGAAALVGGAALFLSQRSGGGNGADGGNGKTQRSRGTETRTEKIRGAFSVLSPFLRCSVFYRALRALRSRSLRALRYPGVIVVFAPLITRPTRSPGSGT
jgi:APA family basic amino acid/polyamine antiporter